MKKGFTLIELLAVIVILAIISIIAVPIVINIINDTKESAILRSADFYLDAVENSIAAATLKNIQIQNGTYQVMNDGNVCVGTLEDNTCTGDILEVEIDGERPSSGSITIENGKISNVNIIISNKEICKNPDTGKLEYKDNVELPETNTPEVVLDPGLYDKNNKLLLSWDELNEKSQTEFEMSFEDLIGIGEINYDYDAGFAGMVVDSIENASKLIISDSITSIGDYAFQGCTNLESITIPEGVTSIGIFVFIDCKNLKNVTLPESLMYIGARAFEGTNISTITIPGNVTEIGIQAFAQCKNLKTVTIEEGVTAIRDTAFSSSGITSITIPSSVTNIEFYAFRNCTNLESIKVDSNNPVYDSRDNSNAIIETATGKLIAGSKNTIIPNSVTSIGGGAFDGITIENITIPSSVTNIEIEAFYNCTNLTNIKVDSNNPVYDSRDNSNAIIETATNTLILGSKNTIIPNSVTGIGVLAFRGNKTIGSITIPSSVTWIGSEAFVGSSIKNITILNPDVEIYGNIFNNCTNLTTIYYKGTATGTPWGAPNATVVKDF